MIDMHRRFDQPDGDTDSRATYVRGGEIPDRVDPHV